MTEARRTLDEAQLWQPSGLAIPAAGGRRGTAQEEAAAGQSWYRRQPR